MSQYYFFNKNLLSNIRNGKVLKHFDTYSEVLDFGVFNHNMRQKIGKWYMKNVGAGATFRKNIRLVELPSGEKVWWAEIVDNDFEEKVADWIFDEEGNTLLCYPDPKEFNRILIEIDRKHGLDEFGEPIKPIKKAIKKVTA